MKALEEKILSIDTKYLKLAKRILLVVALLLYILFLYQDFKGGKSAGIKYVALWVAVLISFTHVQQWTGRITMLAMLLTAVADAFLLLAGKGYGFGIGVFCVVQLLYAVRLRIPFELKDTIKAVMLRVALVAIVVVFVILFQVKNKLGILAAIYFVLLLANMMDSMSLSDHEEDRGSLFSIGLMLFILCDICVGLNNFDSEIVDYIRRPVEIGMWLFYYPSQVLIAASAGRFKLVEQRQRGEDVTEKDDESAGEPAVKAEPAAAREKKPAAHAAVTTEKPEPDAAKDKKPAAPAAVTKSEEALAKEAVQAKIEEFAAEIEAMEIHEPELVFDVPEMKDEGEKQ